MTKPIVCIVDAFSTGAELAVQFDAYGFKTIHVQSSPRIDPELLKTFRSDDFIDHFVYHQNWEELLAFARSFIPKHVIAGTETGVILADNLASALSLPCNDPTTSHLRRNKYAMNEALKQNSIPSVEQHCCSSSEEAIAWAESYGYWPVVAKPLDSAGTDNVYFCYSSTEVEQACFNILGHVNRMGSTNNQVLMQECLHGQQYFINAVSINGTHLFTEFWKDTKLQIDGASMICDREELLPFDGAEQEQIKSYMSRVLDCLGVKEGASHSELMFTARGPILIESAARMQGTILHEALIAAIGDSHVTTTVERYAAPERFESRIGSGYLLNKHLLCVTLASDVSGTVIENNVETKLKLLPSFYAVFHTPAPGERLERTVDLFSNPGIIYLLHQNAEQVEQDYLQIRSWEKEKAFFVVEE